MVPGLLRLVLVRFWGPRLCWVVGRCEPWAGTYRPRWASDVWWSAVYRCLLGVGAVGGAKTGRFVWVRTG